MQLDDTVNFRANGQTSIKNPKRTNIKCVFFKTIDSLLRYGTVRSEEVHATYCGMDLDYNFYNIKFSHIIS